MKMDVTDARDHRGSIAVSYGILWCIKLKVVGGIGNLIAVSLMDIRLIHGHI